jgi:type IV secretion system protein VirB1
MLPGMEMLACPNLAVSPEVMQHIVHVESGANPYAIGVVGGQLERQPRNLAEALATAQMLDTGGYNFSVGLAQVNRANLGRYGLDSYQKAFSACANLSAGAHILADCYTSAHGDWGKAFSCYYSGNFATGFRDGYVQKVYASISHEASEAGKAMPASVPATEAIALRSPPAAPAAAGAPLRATYLKPVTVYASGDASYRVALRSMAIDAAAAATVPAIVAAISQASPANAPASSDTPAVGPSGADTYQTVPAAPGRVDAALASTLTAINQAPTAPSSPNDAVFVPKVRGPNDLPDASASTESIPAPTQATSSNAGADRADLRREQRDAAFVF